MTFIIAQLSWSRTPGHSKRPLNSPEAMRAPPTVCGPWKKHFRCSAGRGISWLPTPRPASWRGDVDAARKAAHGHGSTDSPASKRFTYWERCTTSPRRLRAVLGLVVRRARRSRRSSPGMRPRSRMPTSGEAATNFRGSRADNGQPNGSHDRLPELAPLRPFLVAVRHKAARGGYAPMKAGRTSTRRWLPSRRLRHDRAAWCSAACGFAA